MFLLAGCDIETSGNGNLDGQWRMETIDTLATDGRYDLGDDTRTWSVQHHLLELRDLSGTSGAFLLRFEQSDGRLRTFDPYVFNRTDGDYPLENAAYMAPFGINQLADTFAIEQLSSRRMTLRDAHLRLHFRKLN